MVNIWKIGAWPGIRRYTPTNIGFYIDSALNDGYVAIGYKKISSIKKTNRMKIRKILTKEDFQDIEQRIEQIINFGYNIKSGDVILLLHARGIYIGIVNKGYYYDKNGFLRNPFTGNKIGQLSHKIGVDWKFHKKKFDTEMSFSKLQDAVVKIEKKHLDWINDKRIRIYLKKKLKQKADRITQNDLIKVLGTFNVNKLPRQPNPEERKRIENFAIEKIRQYYEMKGYVVESYEKKNYGFDLMVKLHRETLLLEVKGLNGNNLCTELTPNEFEIIKKNKKNYRICIVSNIARKSKENIFQYSVDDKEWKDQYGQTLIIKPITSISARIRLKKSSEW